MATVALLTLWNDSVTAVSSGDHQGALSKLSEIQQGPDKPFFGFWFNIGKVYLDLQRLQDALESLNEQVRRDEHMAIGYYLRGCINYRLNRHNEALSDFVTCHSKLRGKPLIDYSQLGLRHKLHACEALYNAGILHLDAGAFTAGMDCLLQALRCGSAAPRHAVIQQTIDRVSQQGLNYRGAVIIDLPPDTFFRPPRDKIANKHRMDYLGQAKVVSASDCTDRSVGFMGPKRLEEAQLRGETLSAPNSPLSPGRPKGSDTDTKSIPLPSHKTKLSNSDTDIRSSRLPPPPNKKLPPVPNKTIPSPPARQPPQIKLSTSSDEESALPTRTHAANGVAVKPVAMRIPMYGLPINPSDLKKKISAPREEIAKSHVPVYNVLAQPDPVYEEASTVLPSKLSSCGSQGSGHVTDDAPPVPPKSPLLHRSPLASQGTSSVFFSSVEEAPPELPPRVNRIPKRIGKNNTPPDKALPSLPAT